MFVEAVEPMNVIVRFLFRSAMLTGSLILGGCGGDTTASETVAPPPAQETQATEPPEMVNIVRLTNGSVLYPKSVSTDGEVVTLGFPELGEITFAKDEVASVDEVPATTIFQLATQTDEGDEGFIYANGQWTTRADAEKNRRQRNHRIKRHYYPTTEQGLRKAQRALEKAIKGGASQDELQQIKEAIRKIRRTLAKRHGQRRKRSTARAKTTSKEKENPLGIPELGSRGRSVTFEQHSTPEGREKVRQQVYEEAVAREKSQ